MASDTNNCGVRLCMVGSFEFLNQCFACTEVCEPFTFNLGLNSHRYPEGFNAVDPLSLWFKPHLGL